MSRLFSSLRFQLIALVLLSVLPAIALILYTGIPTSVVYAEANRALTRNLITLGLVAGLVLAVACLFVNLVVMRRVNALIGTTARLAGGDLGARTGISSGSNELELLGTAFDAMAESLEKKSIERDRMEAALRRSEERYRTLVEQIPVVTYTAALDEARSILFISPQVDSLLGFDQLDFYEGRDTWSKRLHAEDRERVLEELSRCRKEKDLFICEYRMLTFNNYVKWIRDEAVIVLSDAGEPLFIQGVMADITEQKRSEEELVKAHKELETRVAQRTEVLAKANEELRQSGEKLKSFAASVVHDLKSPAIGAYGLTKLLWKQYGDTLDEKGMHYCDQIMKASEHVVELAEKINVYIATKETPLRIEAVDLRELLGTLREEFSSRIAARPIRWLEPVTEIVVRADKLSLLRMFRNFIDNALKYGGDQLSEIRIGYEESDRLHIFSVSDDGQGVSEEDAEKIFEMFQRSSSSLGIEGAGLGMAIVTEIAEKHGGGVSVKAGLEKGVSFSCSISKDL
jgi:PAS domain S-box-containing protein